MEKMSLTRMSALDKFIVLRAAEITGFKDIISVKDVSPRDIEVFTVSNEDHSVFWDKVDILKKGRTAVNRLRVKLFIKNRMES